MAANDKHKKKLAIVSLPKDVKKKLPFGGPITPEQATKYSNIGGGLQAGAQAVSMVDGMDGKPSTLGGVASGAMSGASMGMALGPWGAAAGAAIGGGLALLQAEQAKKDQAKAEKKYMNNLTDQNNFMSQQTLRNYSTSGVTSNGSYAYGGELPEYGKGGKIHIKKANRGKFTAYKKRTGKTTEEALHSKDPHVRKMANFAKNAKKWKHKGKKKYALGGELNSYQSLAGGGNIDNGFRVLKVNKDGTKVVVNDQGVKYLKHPDKEISWTERAKKAASDMMPTKADFTDRLEVLTDVDKLKKRVTEKFSRTPF